MKNQRGSVLVFALIVLSFILVTAFSLAAVSLIERRSSGASVNSSTAFQNSDEGMEEFLQQLYKELDPNDDLADMGSQLNAIYGSGYVCCDSNAGCTDYNTSGSTDPLPARIGSQDTEFIITAYKEGTGIAAGSGGWEQTIPITGCNEPLANVSRFRATGNYNNASRAVFLKLRDSLTRGLVAHWSFEDRANVARITEKSKRDERTSYLAQDYSKQDHTLTLCALLSANAIGVDTDDDGIEDAEIAEFTGCAYADPGGMNPKRGYYESSMGHTDSPNENDDDEYDASGSWVEGIVKEDPSTTPPPPGGTTGAMDDDSNSEALYFDGSHYLAAWSDTSCPTDTVNCIEAGNNKLDLVGADGNADGIAISAWVKGDGGSGNMGIVSRYKGGTPNRGGYRLWIQGDDVYFELRNGGTSGEIRVNNIISNVEWTHVVVTWRDNEKMKMYINGDLGDDDNFSPSEIAVPDRPLIIGARQRPDGSPTDYFNGKIDDVRIWNRALTECEVSRLCKDVVDTTSLSSGVPTCTVPTGC